ncbi:hypothetical protein AgCh_016710 [Apium graveolens]
MVVEKLRKQGRPQEDEEMDSSFDLRSQDFEIHDNENPVDSTVAKLFPSSKATGTRIDNAPLNGNDFRSNNDEDEDKDVNRYSLH